jgi:hypothetical protein
VLGIADRKGPKSLQLVGEALHIRVRHGAADGDAVDLACQDVARGIKAGQITGAGNFEGRVCAVGAPQGKVDEAAPLCRFHTARSFRGNERLQMHRVDNETFHQLGVHNGGGDFEHGLMAKEHTAFGKGDDIALKAPRRQVR